MLHSGDREQPGALVCTSKASSAETGACASASGTYGNLTSKEINSTERSQQSQSANMPNSSQGQEEDWEQAPHNRVTSEPRKLCMALLLSRVNAVKATIKNPNVKPSAKSFKLTIPSGSKGV